MIFNTLLESLNNAKVKYAISGGYAVVIHGFTRATADIDLIVEWNLSQLKKIENVLIDLGFKSRVPVKAEDVFHFRDEYIKKRNMIAWSFYHEKHPLETIDIIIKFDLLDFKTETKMFAQTKLVVLDIPSLIATKQDTQRPKDLEDIRHLEEIYAKKSKSK